MIVSDKGSLLTGRRMLIVDCSVTSRFIGSIRQTSVSPHQSAAVGDREPGLGFVTTACHHDSCCCCTQHHSTQWYVRTEHRIIGSLFCKWSVNFTSTFYFVIIKVVKVRGEPGNFCNECYIYCWKKVNFECFVYAPMISVTLSNWQLLNEQS